MPLKPLRVLLVEDDQDDYLIIRDTLRDIGAARYQVTWRSDFQSALEAMALEEFDVCLVDYRLGEHDGLELLAEFRSRGFETPCILLTGQGDYDVDVEAMKAGASDYLIKNRLHAPTLERSIRYAIAQKLAEKHLRESEAQLRFLSSKLLSVQEDERRKIAAELHDNLGQTLTAIKLGVENAMIHIENGTASTALLKPLVPALQDSIEEVRRIYTHLRPSLLDDLGILPTINWLVREFRKANPGIPVEMRLTAREEDVPQILKVVIFRVLQDAMENVARHSGADLLTVALEKKDSELVLEIEDNGVGFDAESLLSPCAVPRGLGLISIRERVKSTGGRTTITSSPGQHTRIHIAWPA